MKLRGFSEWRAWSNGQWAYAATLTLLILAAFAIVIGGSSSGASGSPDDVSQRIVDNSPSVTDIRDCYVDRTELNSTSGGDDQYFLCRVLFAKAKGDLLLLEDYGYGGEWHDACFRLDDSDGKIYEQVLYFFGDNVTGSFLWPVDQGAGDCASDQGDRVTTDGEREQVY